MESRRAYFLSTERLGFGVWSAADLPLAIALWGDPKVTALIGGPFTRDMIQDRLDREISSFNSYGVQYWPVFLRANGSHAGCAGLRPHRLDDRIYELGFHFRPEYWGQAWRMRLRVPSSTMPGNNQSRRALRRPPPCQRLLATSPLQARIPLTHEELYPPTGLNHPSYLLSRPAVSLIQSPP